MNKKQLLIFVFIFLYIFPVFAQETDRYKGFPDFLENLLQDDNETGRVRIIQDERVNLLVQRHIDHRKQQQGIPGFRIRIFSGDSRDLMNAEMARFLRDYPEFESYRDYQAPYFRIYIGDFYDRSEAIKALRKISSDFPNAFIVYQQVKVPTFE